MSSILRNTNIYGRVRKENQTFPLLDYATSLLHTTHFFFKVLSSDQAQTLRLSHSKDIKPNEFWAIHFIYMRLSSFSPWRSYVVSRTILFLNLFYNFNGRYIFEIWNIRSFDLHSAV